MLGLCQERKLEIGSKLEVYNFTLLVLYMF